MFPKIFELVGAGSGLDNTGDLAIMTLLVVDSARKLEAVDC